MQAYKAVLIVIVATFMADMATEKIQLVITIVKVMLPKIVVVMKEIVCLKCLKISF
jgi:hypothetical protein